MPVIAWEQVPPPGAGTDIPSGVMIFRWPKTGTTFAQNDTGQPLECGAYERKTVQVIGTLNGATITMEGSLDPDPATATFAGVSDQGGTALGLTAAGIKSIQQDVNLLRPSVTVATPTTLTILVRLSMSGRR